MEEIMQMIKGRLIVSCQALDDEPLHSSFIMGRMAIAAQEGGAGGIRANTPEDVIEIKNMVSLPVIGLYKQIYPDSEVYITPTMKEVDAMVSCGCDVIALDATCRARPGGMRLPAFFRAVREKYPLQIFMADCSDYEECLNAQDLGFDVVGTTMRGYTSYTKGVKIPDFELLAKLRRSLTVPFIAEGGIWDPCDARRAIECGAHAVVVGSAITRPQLITRRFARAVEEASV